MNVFIKISIILLILFLTAYSFMGQSKTGTETYKYKIYAKKVVRAYKEINNALYKAEKEYGNFNSWSLKLSSDKDKLEDMMKNMNIKKKKDCGMNDKEGGCWWSSKYITNTSIGIAKSASDYYTFIDKHNNAVYVYKDPIWGFLMVYDVNGKERGPNMRGEDIFYFQTGPDNIEFVPGGEDQLASNMRLKYGCFKNKFCTAWVVRTGNMDYMEADSHGVCPNGKQLSWFNTSCK